MRRVLILTAVLCQSVFGYASYSGWCENGGVKVTVQGLSSPLTFQQSFPNLKQSADGPNVTVYATGTTDKATLYSDNDGTPLNNPFPCSSTGQYQFFSTNSVVDLLFSGSGISAFTRSAIAVTDGCPTNSTCDGSYKTLSAACTAAGTGTLYLTRTWSGLVTQTLACNIQALANGIIKPASGQTVTLSGSFDGDLTQHFDLSGGGTVNLSGAKIPLVSVLWFGGSTPITSALGAAGTNFVLIPATYAGTDAYVAANKNIIDLRQPAFETYQFFACSHNITGFPLGNDCNLIADGPADLIIQHNKLGNAISTITGTFSPGTQNITVACTIPATYTPGSACQFSALAGLYTDYGNTNQEAATINSITPPHTLNVTFIRSHGPGTIDVFQAGHTAFAGQSDILLGGNACPPNSSEYPDCPTPVGNSNGIVMLLPNNNGAAFPLNAIQFGGPLTCTHSVGMNAPKPLPDNCFYRNSDASHVLIFQASDGTENMRFTDGNFSVGENSSTFHVGSFLFNPASCSGTCTINPALGISQTQIMVAFATGAGTTTAVTVTGATAGSHCSLTPTNAAASTMIYTSPGIYISTKAANTITVTHGSGLSGAQFDLSCGSY